MISIGGVGFWQLFYQSLCALLGGKGLGIGLTYCIWQRQIGGLNFHRVLLYRKLLWKLVKLAFHSFRHITTIQGSCSVRHQKSTRDKSGECKSGHLNARVKQCISTIGFALYIINVPTRASLAVETKGLLSLWLAQLNNKSVFKTDIFLIFVFKIELPESKCHFWRLLTSYSSNWLCFCTNLTQCLLLKQSSGETLSRFVSCASTMVFVYNFWRKKGAGFW